MSDFPLEFEVVEQAEDSAFTALQALVPRFDLTTGASHKIRRTWLDTFDWRLYRAGLVLEDSEAGGQHRLTLTSDTGERWSSELASIRWPSSLDRLPASGLRDRVDSVAGIRALLPVAEARSSVQEVRVLNSDAKTVARVVLDRPAMPGRSGTSSATHLAVVPMRGYDSESDRVARILSRATGVQASRGSVYEQALASAGRQPRDYVSKIDIPLGASMPAPLAVATVLETFLETLEANLSGVIADIDTEFLHDFRVAVRRTRATLKLTGDVLPDSMADRFAPAFKWLGDLTTPTRDLDVFLLGFDGMAGDLQAADAADLDPFHAHLATEREAARRRLARGLKSQRFQQLLTDWRLALSGVTASRADGSLGLTASELAAKRVKRAYRRVIKHGSAITADSPAEHLHTLRKRCKELRYLLEIFASLHEPTAHRRVVKELKALQECLGDFQDGEVQRHTVGAYVTQMTNEASVPTETLLAMGELAAQVDTRKRQARNDYAYRWDQFTRGKNRHAVAELTRATAA